MANGFVFPTAAELREIEQTLLPRLADDRLIFKYMPITDLDNHILSWEQQDNYVGLQQLRGLDGKPSRVKRVGGKKYNAEPGVYGEYIPLDETELTRRRQFGTFGTPIDLSDLVRQAQDQLLVRRLDRIELIGWTLLTTGTFSVSGPAGIIHYDTFPIQTATRAVDWDTVATATPLADFRAIQLLSRGTSTTFNSSSEAVMNRVTFNKLVSNTNANDLAGKRVGGLLSPLSLDEANKVLLGEDLPQIRICDDGYLTDAGVFTPFIPDDKVVIIGQRRGLTICEYLMTRNINNPNFAPGSYSRVIIDEDEIPLKVEVHDGHNGGPAIYFPGSVVVLSV
jgi:hypothetical protein